MRGRKAALILRLVGVGWFVAICIGGGAAGGWLADRWLGVAPLLTLLGLGVGIAAGVAGMYRMLMAALRAQAEP